MIDRQCTADTIGRRKLKFLHVSSQHSVLREDFQKFQQCVWHRCWQQVVYYFLKVKVLIHPGRVAATSSYRRYHWKKKTYLLHLLFIKMNCSISNVQSCVLRFWNKKAAVKYRINLKLIKHVKAVAGTPVYRPKLPTPCKLH